MTDRLDTQEASAVQADSEAGANESETNEGEDDPTLTLEQVAKLQKLADELFSDVKFEAPGSWQRLPDWLDPNDLPFDANQYFPSDAVTDGGQDYMRAVARTSLSDALSWLPDFMKELENQPEVEPQNTKLSAYSEQDDLFYKVRDRLLVWVYDSEVPDEPTYFDQQAPIYITRLDDAINDLKKAKQCQQVFIPQDFSLDALTPDHGFRNIARDLSIVCLCDDLDKSLEAVELTIQIDRNLRNLGSEMRQLVSASVLEFAIDYQVPAILQTGPDDRQMKSLIDILHSAHRSEIETPRDLELARFEHLQLRKLIHELRTESFEADPDTLDYYSISKELPQILLVHQLMSSIYMGGFVANDVVAVETVEEMFGKGSKEVEKAKKAIEASNSSPLTTGGSAGFIVAKVAASFEEMVDRDFDQEISLLKQRYADVESAIQMPFPKRIEEMEVLREQWIRDERWKKSKFLKWYKPKRFTGKLSVRARLLIDGTLTLACVRKFQIDNDGRLPNDVAEALKAAGIDKPEEVIDPYSGLPFKLTADDLGRPQVYSIGPDRIDNQGSRSLIASEFTPTDEGDVVFSIKK